MKSCSSKGILIPKSLMLSDDLRLKLEILIPSHQKPKLAWNMQSSEQYRNSYIGFISYMRVANMTLVYELHMTLNTVHGIYPWQCQPMTCEHSNIPFRPWSAQRNYEIIYIGSRHGKLHITKLQSLQVFKILKSNFKTCHYMSVFFMTSDNWWLFKEKYIKTES